MPGKELVFEIALVIHGLSTFCMTGLIWIVQTVHYPAFSYIDKKRFRSFEAFHMKQISYLVVPLMLIELITGLIAIASSPSSLFSLLSLNLALLGGIWIYTWQVSAKIHELLLKSFEETLVERLVSTNWLRTILWSTRSFIVVVALIFFERLL